MFKLQQYSNSFLFNQEIALLYLKEYVLPSVYIQSTLGTNMMRTSGLLMCSVIWKRWMEAGRYGKIIASQRLWFDKMTIRKVILILNMSFPWCNMIMLYALEMLFEKWKKVVCYCLICCKILIKHGYPFPKWLASCKYFLQVYIKHCCIFTSKNVCISP